DVDYFTKRQLESVRRVGKTLSGVPQLGTAAAIAGAAAAYVVRRIAVGAEMPSGRYVLSCEQAFPESINDA
ncbi:MAG: hypothetical protein NUV59_02480, partial [Patescibacteria group bacterium]|nr:hypothetical protein [Patescibacteria group bacterium]